MKLMITSRSGRVPKYETKQAAGFDIAAFLPDGPLVLGAGERALVPTGLSFQLPEGYEAQIRARSGLAARNGIGLVNGIGTVDADYRGEIKVAVINFSKEDFMIKDGMRIAQIMVSKFEKADIELVKTLSRTERGPGGFGHTGV